MSGTLLGASALSRFELQTSFERMFDGKTQKKETLSRKKSEKPNLW